jgi:BirA family biotin operon repressor/biotin-[acetyl-CoA-carboxylase] ligase
MGCDRPAEGIETGGLGFPVIELDEVGSTNSEALRRAGEGARGPQWIITRRQSAGRGRSGRTWLSREGNLAATLLLSPRCQMSDLHQLSLLTGVAVHDALAELAGGSQSAAAAGLRLKWPNDILLGEAKLGGILIESTMCGGQIMAAVGIGVNIAEAPSIAGRAVAAVSGLGATPSPRELLDGLDRHMRRWLAAWAMGARFDVVRAAWLARCGGLGQAIEINTGAERLCGAFAGIDETGALLIDSVTPSSETPRRFTFGDVNLLSRASQGSI